MLSSVTGCRRFAVSVAATRGVYNTLPLMNRCYATAAENDVVIIGGGPGGYVAAIKAGQLGLKVACIEKRGSLGGTCLNVGCIPSKALLHASHMYEQATKEFSHHGVKVSGVEIDLPTMMKSKDTAVSGLTKGIEGLFKKNKVTYHKGHGTIMSPNEIKVTAADGTSEVVRAKNIIIATGSDVMSIPGVTIDEKRIISSTGALKLSEIPKKLVVIGGGVIGLEMGSVWARLGSQVTVVEFQNMICAGGGVDEEICKSFQQILKKKNKFEFIMETKVVSAKASASGVKIEIESIKDGSKQTLDADYVLVSTGRRPFTDNLGLENVGIQTDKRGRIPIEHGTFRTSVKNIFAIGDCIEGPMLAHKSEEEGIACIENIAGKGGHVNYNAIPGVIYTSPEVGCVGKTEQELKAAGVKYKVGKFPFIANSRARTNDDADGMVKVIADAETDRILGVHILGTNAGELIAEMVLAIEYGASSEDVARTCHAHPTLSEAVKEACMAVYDKPIHF